MADRPTTSRWAPLNVANAPIKSDRSSKARTEADTSSGRHPTPGSQILSSQTSVQPSTLREPSPARAPNIQHRESFRSGTSRPRICALATIQHSAGAGASLRNATIWIVSAIPAARSRSPPIRAALPPCRPADAASLHRRRGPFRTRSRQPRDRRRASFRRRPAWGYRLLLDCVRTARIPPNRGGPADPPVVWSLEEVGATTSSGPTAGNRLTAYAAQLSDFARPVADITLALPAHSAPASSAGGTSSPSPRTRAPTHPSRGAG